MRPVLHYLLDRGVAIDFDSIRAVNSGGGWGSASP